MYLISAEGYKNAEAETKTVRKTGEIWVSMKDVGSGMGVKNIPDYVLKEPPGVLKTKIPTKEEISESESELYENFDNLSREELNEKSNETIYVRNDAKTTIIKCCRGENKRGIRAMDRFRKKINDSRF